MHVGRHGVLDPTEQEREFRDVVGVHVWTSDSCARNLPSPRDDISLVRTAKPLPEIVTDRSCAPQYVMGVGKVSGMNRWPTAGLTTRSSICVVLACDAASMTASSLPNDTSVST